MFEVNYRAFPLGEAELVVVASKGDFLAEEIAEFTRRRTDRLA